MAVQNGAENATSNAERDFVIELDGKVLGNVSEVNVTIIFNLFGLYSPTLIDFAAASSIIFMIFGIPANIISAVALAKSKKLRNATTPLVINLCVVDLFFCCFNLPLITSNYLNRQWVLGDGLCKFYAFIRFLSTGLNLFTVMAIAFNRYILIVHPNYYRKIFKKFITILIILSIWIVATLMLTPSLLAVWGSFGYDPEEGMCSIIPDKKNRSQKISLFVSAFIIPSAVFAYCYVRIYWVVRRSHRKVSRPESKMLPPKASDSVDSGVAENERAGRKSFWMKWINTSSEDKKLKAQRSPKNLNRNMRLVRTILVIFCTLIICYLPQAILKILKKEKEAPVVNVVGYLGMYFPNVINPVIYVVMSKEYRQAYKDLLCCFRNATVSNTDSTDDN